MNIPDNSQQAPKGIKSLKNKKQSVLAGNTELSPWNHVIFKQFPTSIIRDFPTSATAKDNQTKTNKKSRLQTTIYFNLQTRIQALL